MTDNVISHPRWALMHKKASERQIADSSESVHLQERIFVDDFYKFLDARGFFKDHEKRQLLGIALVITCDTIGDMEITIKDSKHWWAAN
jgi:hypothetical protein